MRFTVIRLDGFWGLEVNGIVIDYYIELEALANAIDSIKAINKE